MKITISIIIFILSFQCLASDRQLISPKALTDPLVIKLLTLSESEMVYGQSGRDSDFAAKLYRVGHQGSCVPETHFICSYEYYLALYEYGDPGELGVYYLGKVGKIDNIKATKGETSSRAYFELTVSDYPEYVKKRKTKKITLLVSLELVENNLRFVVNAQ